MEEAIHKAVWLCFVYEDSSKLLYGHMCALLLSLV